MATQKPSKPNVTLPDNFGGIKTPYSDAQIRDGYQDGVPEIVDGGNINYEKDALFQNTKYLRAVADTLVDMPIGKVLTVDSNNRFEYEDKPDLTSYQVKSNLSQTLDASTTKYPSNAAVKAVTDTKQDIATAVNYKNITNCITEIPQDIKLELADGVLTLKAGSKVYGGDGSNIILNNDLVVSPSSGDGTFVVFVNIEDNKAFANQSPSACTSGTTPPTDSGMFYNTSTKVVAFYKKGVLESDNWSLPLAIVTVSSGTVTSVDQVFNGFGYIGSTIFALPGVSGLIPNYRNPDGSLKNIEFTTDKVLTFTQSYTQNCYFYFKNNGNTIAQVDQSDYSYDNIRNIQKTANEIQGVCIFASAREDAGVISNFTPKTAFHALDYNDKSVISGWGMPSTRYIDLTLGASGTSYKAPANGYFAILKSATATKQYMQFRNATTGLGIETHATSENTALRQFVPVKNGDTVVIAYSAAGTLHFFRFIYAEGDN